MIANPASSYYQTQNPSTNNKVVWDDGVCQSTCPTCPANDCTTCDKSKSSKSADDPKTWLTCSSSECQGSLTMAQKAACVKAVGGATSSRAYQAGSDMAGMFSCIAGQTGLGCTFDSEIAKPCAALGSHSCPSFTVYSDDEGHLEFQGCDSSGAKTSTTATSVAFAPFGNNIAPNTQQSLGKTAKRKLPGWD